MKTGVLAEAWVQKHMWRLGMIASAVEVFAPLVQKTAVWSSWGIDGQQSMLSRVEDFGGHVTLWLWYLCLPSGLKNGLSYTLCDSER